MHCTTFIFYLFGHCCRKQKSVPFSWYDLQNFVNLFNGKLSKINKKKHTVYEDIMLFWKAYQLSERIFNCAYE